MPQRSAPEIEKEIRALLTTECTLVAQGLYLQMRYVAEDNFADLKSPEDAGTIPEELPPKLAGRDSGRTPAILSQLKKAKLVVDTDGGVRLPHVCEIFKVRFGQRLRKQRERAHEGVTSRPDGCDIGCDLPPQVSSPPITPSSSFPTHSHPAGAMGENPDPGQALDSRIRAFIGGHRMLEYSHKRLAIMRQMVESGGWEATVNAIDEALASGAAEPFTYARSIMSGRQAKSRLKAESKAPERITKVRVYNV